MKKKFASLIEPIFIAFLIALILSWINFLALFFKLHFKEKTGSELIFELAKFSFLFGINLLVSSFYLYHKKAISKKDRNIFIFFAILIFILLLGSLVIKGLI